MLTVKFNPQVNRYFIVDENNLIVNSVNKHGFKSIESANKMIWYLNNESKIRNDALKIAEWWMINQDLEKQLDDMLFSMENDNLDEVIQQFTTQYKDRLYDMPFNAERMIRQRNFAKDICRRFNKYNRI